MKLLLALVLAGSLGQPVANVLPPETEGAVLVACRGCGCRGGPGWRIHRTGQCAGKANLTKECGSPPSTDRCTKEN